MQCQAAFADSTIHRARLTSRGKGIEYTGTKSITPRPFSVFALVLKLFLHASCCSYSILLSTASPVQADEAVRSAVDTLLCKEGFACQRPAPPDAVPTHCD